MSLEDLQQRCEALEQEWNALALQHDVDRLETDFFEREVSEDLGVVGAVAIGVGLIHQTIKALVPLKVSTPLVTGCWAIGGAYCLFRLTAGAATGWFSMTQRNARRKRQLQLKLETLEVLLYSFVIPQVPSACIVHSLNVLCGYSPICLQARIQTLATIARHIHDQEQVPGTPPRLPVSEGAEAPNLAHTSPTGSQSSAELVEVPDTEEYLTGPQPKGTTQQQQQQSADQRKREGGQGGSLDSLRKYAEMGSKKD